MNSISSLIKNYNEENLIKQYKFSKYNFNGIEVMYNPSLAIDKHYIKAKQLKSKIVIPLPYTHLTLPTTLPEG